MNRSASDLIEERTGLAANALLRNDIDTLVRLQTGGDSAAFVERLRVSDETSSTWQAVITALAIGETYFFRDRTHFQLLRNHILPPMILKKRGEQQRTLNIWSAGCATGEEVYSLAIMLYEFLPDLAEWTIRLIGTDINARALELARKAVYRPWSFRHTDPALMRYFDEVEGGMQVKPFIRNMVTFRHLNLFKGRPLPQCDIVLCRNVLFYFTPERALAAENLFYESLSPGGWLLLGSSEALRSSRDQWVTHVFPGAPIYQKLSRPGEVMYRQHTPPPAPPPPPRPQPAVNVAPTYDAAVRAFHNDNIAAAALILTELLTAQPDHAPAHTLMGCVMASRRDIETAHRHLDTALKINPLLADAHYMRALLHIEAKRNPDAMKSLQDTLYCQRNHPLASFMLGTMYAQNGDFRRAVKLWMNARHAIHQLTPESQISDLSDINAGRLDSLIEQQLSGWED